LTRKVEAVHHFIEVSTRADAIGIVSRRLDGSVLDRCGFTRGRPWDCDRAAGAGDASPIGAAVPGAKPIAGEAGEPKRSDWSAADRSDRCLCDAPGSASGRRTPITVLALAMGLAGLSRRRRWRGQPRARRHNGLRG
jgi:hypothetical protein